MTVAGQACRHTDVGSLASYTADTVALELHYNAANLVAKAIGLEAQVTYRYDGEGNLVERQVGPSTVQFLVNPLDPIWRPLQARPSNGPTTSYVWKGDMPLMAITGKRVVFFLHDHLGSVRYSTDDRGQITGRLAYSPFGVPHQSPEQHVLQPAFAGLFFDPDTRLYITPGRSYSPHLGRFVQVDPQHRIPYGSPADLSPYTYSGNDPVNYVDRTGAARECVNPTCLSWQEAIKGWELERQRQLSEATVAQVQIEAGQRVRDAALVSRWQLLRSRPDRRAQNNACHRALSCAHCGGTTRGDRSDGASLRATVNTRRAASRRRTIWGRRAKDTRGYAAIARGRRLPQWCRRCPERLGNAHRSGYRRSLRTPGIVGR